MCRCVRGNRAHNANVKKKASFLRKKVPYNRETDVLSTYEILTFILSQREKGKGKPVHTQKAQP